MADHIYFLAWLATGAEQRNVKETQSAILYSVKNNTTQKEVSNSLNKSISSQAIIWELIPSRTEVAMKRTQNGREPWKVVVLVGMSQ